jgi:lipoprotein-anchoring transpeptidase ErfK/SrfK
VEGHFLFSTVEHLMSADTRSRYLCAALFCAGALAVSPSAAQAQALSYMPAPRLDQGYSQYQPQYQPPAAQSGDVAGDDELAPQLRRQIVSYSGTEAPGTIVIDTAHAFLYLTLGNGRALRYGIGVGREGFTWSGVETISRVAEWPDWIPPAEMVARQPYLPRWVGGGPGNPLGARALYLGNTDYRIHGTNAPDSIGKHVSSGCIRMLNADVIDLYGRVGIGTRVVVLPNDQRRAAADGRSAAIDARGGPSMARIPVTRVSDEAPSTAPPRPSGLY